MYNQKAEYLSIKNSIKFGVNCDFLIIFYSELFLILRIFKKK